MNNELGRRIITILALTFSSMAHSSDDYKCKIERVITSYGKSESVSKMYEKAFEGSEFTVERSAGTMAGALKNTNSGTPKVISYGSKENAYRVVTTPTVNGITTGGMYYLDIAEFEDGKIKPFLYVENEKVYFGSCEHF